MQKKNTLNANNDTTATANNQDFLDLLGLDMSSTTTTQSSNTTIATSNALNTNMNNVLMGTGVGGGGGGGLGDLSSILSTTGTTTTAVPTNGNDLSSIMAAASITSPTMDLQNTLINDPLATTTASNNVSVVS